MHSDALCSQPRGQIINRTTCLRDLATRIAALLEEVHDLDDLVLQMDTTEAARIFITDWKQARIILDAGHGPTRAHAPRTASARTVETASLKIPFCPLSVFMSHPQKNRRISGAKPHAGLRGHATHYP